MISHIATLIIRADFDRMKNKYSVAFNLLIFHSHSINHHMSLSGGFWQAIACQAACDEVCRAVEIGHVSG